MTKDDYKAEFEEHRKEIGLDEDDDNNLPSRAELHRKNRKPSKKSGTKTINVILGLFTLIPVLILIYVISNYFFPDETPSAEVENPGFLYETGGEKPDAESSEKDSALNEKKESPDGKTDPAKTADKNVATDAKTPTAKPDVIVNPTPPKEVKPEKKPEPVEKKEPKSVGKTHTVASNETLYRISVNYYGSGSDASIEKIKRANGLTSNEIRTGQKLIIP